MCVTEFSRGTVFDVVRSEYSWIVDIFVENMHFDIIFILHWVDMQIGAKKCSFCTFKVFVGIPEAVDYVFRPSFCAGFG